MTPPPAYIVTCDGPMAILAVYVGPRAARNAHVHARTITGASVVCVQTMTDLPESVRDLINEDFEDEDDDTPVTDPT